MLSNPSIAPFGVVGISVRKQTAPAQTLQPPSHPNYQVPEQVDFLRPDLQILKPEDLESNQ